MSRVMSCAITVVVLLMIGCVDRRPDPDTDQSSRPVSCDPTLQCTGDDPTDGLPEDRDACPCVVAPPINTLAIDGSAFQAITSATSVDHTNGCTFTGGIGVQAELPLLQGVSVSAVRFYVTDSRTGPTILQGSFEGRAPSGALTGHVSSGSNGTGVAQVLSATPMFPTLITTSKGYFLQVFYSSGSATSNLAFAEVDYN